MNSIGRHLTQLDTPSVGTRLMMDQEEEPYIPLTALKLDLDDMWQLISRIREVEIWSCVKLKSSPISVLILHRSTNYLCTTESLVITNQSSAEVHNRGIKLLREKGLL